MKSPYVWMQIFHDPEPMIAALEDCIQVEKEKKARE
jgi:hypothetical protein